MRMPIRVPKSLLLAALVLLVLAGAGAGQAVLAEEVRPVGGDVPEGWSKVEDVPAWVLKTPLRAGWLRFSDMAQSNLLHLCASDEPDLRFLGAEIAWRLRPVLGAGADGVAAAPYLPVLIQKAYHFRPAPKGRRMVVGGQVYTAWRLFEVDLQPLLEQVPEAERARARAALEGPTPDAALPWLELGSDPAWAAETFHVEEGGRLHVVASVDGPTGDLARSEAPYRAAGALRWPVQARLLFLVGNDLAFAAGLRATTYRTIQQRVWREHGGRTRAWIRLEAPVEPILDSLPQAVRQAAREALAGPQPPRPWIWEDVASEPSWVRSPPAWPGHMAFVQVTRARSAEDAKKGSIQSQKQEIAKAIRARLEGVLEGVEVAEAARAGVRARTQGRHALLTTEGRSVAWALWEMPINKILEAVPASKRDAVRAALAP